MIVFPKTLPREVSRVFERAFEKPEAATALEDVARWVVNVFQGKDILVVLKVGDEKPSYRAVTTRSDAPKKFVEQLAARWLEADIDSHVLKDLREHLSPISYSGGCWPYPNCTSDDPLLNLPRDFTMCVPFSSDLIVSDDTDKKFEGYFALMFDSFPPVIDDVIQLIVTLPTLVSEALTVHLRR